MLKIIKIISWIIYIITLSSAAITIPDISNKGKQLRLLDDQLSLDASNDIDMPRFGEPIPNVTVSVGRDALLACVVENLKGYKVAWVRVDTQTILSIHHNVITQNPRISLSYNDHRSWYLHIKQVEESDRGWYMCQINTDPMRSRKGYLQVVVPPMIIEGMTSNDMVVREGTNVTLMCKARGYPEPYVMWRREDGEEMQIGGENVNVVDGEILHITKVSRLHMAAYLCVASNSVPPSISKRVHLRVQFPPMLSIPNQLEGAYMGQDVTLECHTEAYPASINYWTTERGDMIISDTSRAGDKYETTSTTNGYSKYMKLKIHNVGTADFGSYRCVAKNSLGETDGVIKLDEILAPTTAVISEMTTYNRSSGKRPNSKFETNALPDYGIEEWKDGGGGGGVVGDKNQPPIRHPSGAFFNKATSVKFTSSPFLTKFVFGCDNLPFRILCWIQNEFIHKFNANNNNNNKNSNSNKCNNCNNNKNNNNNINNPLITYLIISDKHNNLTNKNTLTKIFDYNNNNNNRIDNDNYNNYNGDGIKNKNSYNIKYHNKNNINNNNNNDSYYKIMFNDFNTKKYVRNLYYNSLLFQVSENCINFMYDRIIKKILFILQMHILYFISLNLISYNLLSRLLLPKRLIR